MSHNERKFECDMEQVMSQDVLTRRLLVVEDEPELREILSDICQPLNAEIICLSSGQEALNILQEHTVDAILSDINMPQMSGLELLAKVRTLGFEIPFIFLTAYHDHINISQALRFGATEFLEKPFDEEKLISYVSLSLDLGSALNQLESEINFFIKNTMIPAEKVVQVKNARKELWKLKLSEQMKKLKRRVS